MDYEKEKYRRFFESIPENRREEIGDKIAKLMSGEANAPSESTGKRGSKMKFNLYSTSGPMADYIGLLAARGFRFTGDGEGHEVYVEIDSLDSLLKLKEVLLFHDLIIQGKNGDYAIEIYDDYRE
jgi:hypothetical protein